MSIPDVTIYAQETSRQRQTETQATQRSSMLPPATPRRPGNNEVRSRLRIGMQLEPEARTGQK